MPLTFKHFLCFLILITSLTYSNSSWGNTPSDPFQWKIVHYHQRDYLPIKNIKDFYHLQQSISHKKLTLKNKLVQVIFKIDSQDCRMNGVLFVMSHPLIIHKGQYLISKTDLLTIIDPVFRPAYIKRTSKIKTVIIDPGHGGNDSGSIGKIKKEKYYTLKIGKLLKAKLLKKGYKVIMTRESDTSVSLSQRVKIANKHPDALFISIHFNSGISRAHGIETYTISPIGTPHVGRNYQSRDDNFVPGNLSQSASVALATAVHRLTLTHLNNTKKYGNNFKIADRGINHARFNVLTGIKIPAILLEGGFLSNTIEASKINTETYQKTVATAIAHAIDVFNNAIPSPHLTR